VLIVVFNYITACMCMLGLQASDPFHFGTLPRAMVCVVTDCPTPPELPLFLPLFLSNSSLFNSPGPLLRLYLASVTFRALVFGLVLPLFLFLLPSLTIVLFLHRSLPIDLPACFLSRLFFFIFSENCEFSL